MTKQRKLYNKIDKLALKRFTFTNNKGCFGRRIKIEPEKSGIIGEEDKLTQRGKVISVGPEAIIKIQEGDIIFFNTDGLDPVIENGNKYYYVLATDQFIYEIL